MIFGSVMKVSVVSKAKFASAAMSPYTRTRNPGSGSCHAIYRACESVVRCGGDRDHGEGPEAVGCL